MPSTTGNAFLEHGKVPPQAVDLEEAVLGAMMIEQDAVSAVIDILKPEVFYKEAHQKIFKAIFRLFGKSEPIDILTVTNELKSSGELEMVGGPYYITMLTSRIASAANVEYHARILIQKYIQRELIHISSEIIKDAYEDTTDVFDLLDKAEQGLFNVSESNLRRNFEDMPSLIKQAIEDIENAKNADTHFRGIPSGYAELDRITTGWQKSDLIILAARPAMGKTAFALSMARNIAVDFDIPVAVFSLEMSAVQLVTRLISSETELPATQLKKGELADYEWHQLNTKIQSLANAKIFIDDTPALSVFELRAKCRRLKQQHDIQMVFIDYLQLMTLGRENRGNREQEISTISRSLKALAKELNVPVLTLSQLSRSVENRTGTSKRPILSDLRESGAIEQDADIVMFIYRPEYYGLDTMEDNTSSEGKAEIIIAKHRNGPTANVKLRFIAKYAKFEDLDAPGMDPDQENYGKGIRVPSKMNDSDDDTPF
ncbi:replicative DNA helicase [Candidatus Sulfidibacterium hydrothermale]|uniref:replicative DNA helicase n=1 Tax=Candidatus Sulfidibacterium hydrothermale TaxID=2875962 RepID=UPI001F0A2E86|nr:replicative DNA helicase [Candidatus Sulfidibacterium hydrothermale]